MKSPRSERTPEEAAALVRFDDAELLKNVLAPAVPAPAPSRATAKLLESAVAIQQEEPTPEDLAYLARELVQCTLPHRDPGQVAFWSRSNGNLTLSIVSGFDPRKSALVGYPYGSIPRLLLFWITTEALLTGNRRLQLGPSYAAFLRDIGLDPNTGGGKRSDAKRVREQTRRLFASSISFIQTVERPNAEGERRLNMAVAEASELWWNPKDPHAPTLWGSWVELGQRFFDAVTSAPVPVDTRALRALKRSPLALDLYAWATHKALSAARRGQSRFVPWRALMKQFGADYADAKDFKKKAQAALAKIQTVYPGLRLGEATGGLLVLPSSRPAIPAKPSQRLLR